MNLKQTSNFLWQLLVVIMFIIFMALLSVESKAQVNIKPETARYFLEADDERVLLKEKDSLSTVTIKSLQKEISFQNNIIVTYEADEITYAAEYDLMSDEIDQRDRYAEKLEKKLRRRKIMEAVFGGGLLLLLLL